MEQIKLPYTEPEVSELGTVEELTAKFGLIISDNPVHEVLL